MGRNLVRADCWRGRFELAQACAAAIAALATPKKKYCTGSMAGEATCAGIGSPFAASKDGNWRYLAMISNSR